MEPTSLDGLAMLRRTDVDVVPSDQFLCHHDDFAAWAGGPAVAEDGGLLPVAAHAGSAT